VLVTGLPARDSGPASVAGGRATAGARALAIGVAAMLAAAAFTVALRNPALPVLGVGIAATAAQVARRRLSLASVIDAVGPSSSPASSPSASCSGCSRAAALFTRAQ
jgi:hypothetical protein